MKRRLQGIKKLQRSYRTKSSKFDTHIDLHNRSLPCCRYCNETAVAYHNKAKAPICGDKECREKNKKMCNIKLPCGHFCYGVHGELNHLPCLEEGCATEGRVSVNYDLRINIL